MSGYIGRDAVSRVEKNRPQGPSPNSGMRSQMSEKSKASGAAILPALLVGLAVGGVILAPRGEESRVAAPAHIAAQDETQIANQAIKQGLAALPREAHSLGQTERNLRLRLNGTEARTLDVAGGLYAIATRHLDESNTPQAMRVAQACADLVPESLLAARCWLLCGQASAATHPDLPLSIRYFERAAAATRNRLLKIPNEVETLRLRATALQCLGQCKERFGRTDEAIRHLRELTDTTAVTPVQSPGDRLRAMLNLSRLLHKTGSIQEADQWFASAQEFALTDAVPANEALHALADFTRTLITEIGDPARSDALRWLWECPRFESLKEWFEVGDELASAYFFHEPRQLADFELVSGKFLASAARILESLPAGSEPRAGLESLYATQLILAAEAARSRSDDAEIARMVKLFESSFHGRDVTFTSPLDRPAQRLHRIGEIYRTTMTGHVEQLRQIQAAGRFPAEGVRR